MYKLCSLLIFALILFTNNLNAQSQFALHFDGNSDYVEIPDSVVLNLTNDFTLELWLNLDSIPGSGRHTYIRKIDSTDAGYSLQTNASNQLVFLGNGTTISIDTLPPVLEWSHLAVTYNSTNTTLNIYLNGNNILTDSSQASYPTNSVRQLEPIRCTQAHQDPVIGLAQAA